MHNIIFFDGVCMLCNSLVDFLLKIDRKGILFFAPLQGESAASILEPELRKNDMVVFRDFHGTVSVKSTAIIEMFLQLGGIWKLFAVFKIIPVAIRDIIYDYIAGHRFRIFGKREQCRMPSAETRGRILP